jgi:hypothetical protein
MHLVICGVIVHSAMENPRAYLILTGTEPMKPHQYLQYLVGTALIFMGICNAHASTVVLEDYQSVSGFTVLNKDFKVDQAGTYEAFLTDLKYPVAFDKLFLGIAEKPGDITLPLIPIGFRYGEGSLIFNVSTPGNFVAQFMGLPGTVDLSGTARVGTYTLQIKAIPIPPAAMLLFSGLMGLVLVGRRTNSMKIA